MCHVLLHCGAVDVCTKVAMGQGQAEVAMQLLQECATNGEWLCLKNLHLVTAWLPTLEKVITSCVCCSVNMLISLCNVMENFHANNSSSTKSSTLYLFALKNVSLTYLRYLLTVYGDGINNF